MPKKLQLKILEKKTHTNHHWPVNNIARVFFLCIDEKIEDKNFKFEFGAQVRATAPAHTQRASGVY